MTCQPVPFQYSHDRTGSAGGSVTTVVGPQPSSRSWARQSAALSRPLSKPSAAAKTSSAVRPIWAALRSIALIALRLVLGLRRSFSSALRICASGVLSSTAPRDCGAFYHHEPRRSVAVGAGERGFLGQPIRAQVERYINSNRLFLNGFIGRTRII